jgi:UPF0755 protein
MSRSEEERERARLEREAKRAKRRGDPPPAADPPPATDAFGSPGATESISDDPVAAAEAVPAPPATAREWREAAGDPEPDPPLVRRTVRGEPPSEPAPAEDPFATQPYEPAAPPRRIPPAPAPYAPGERPLGTRRASAAERGGIASPPVAPPPRARAPRGPGGRRPRVGRLVAGVVALLALIVLVTFVVKVFQPFHGDGSGTVVVKIPAGATAGAIGDLLEQRGVIASSRYFGIRARIAGKRDQLKAGTFTLRRDMSYGAAMDALSKNPPAPKTIRLTIPEGRSRLEVAPTVKAAGLSGSYLAASDTSSLLSPRKYGAPKGTKTLEGFLFPATYELRPGAKASALVAQQLQAFKDNIAHVDLRAAKRKNLTVYDIVTIASMIEREAGIPKDRRLVAAVIYNRLKEGMPLGIDATIRYERRNWTRPLRVSELQADTPYNTRKRTGLPPTPIGSPGLAALEAAARPAKVPYLFYVVKPCGKGAHAFSATDAQFQKDVAAYNRARDAAGGKSPVNC